MQHVHTRDWVDAGTTVKVDCDRQCNVMVMDDQNYSAFRRGASFRYLGGFYKRLHAAINVSGAGHWNTVIALDGGRANIKYSIDYIV